MITLDELCTLVEKLKIRVIFANLRKQNPDYLGKADAATRTITLDISLRDNYRQLKCVLSEEIGHILYPPCCGHIRYHSRAYWQTDHLTRSKMQYNVAKDERMALDWATGILITDEQILSAKDRGINTLPLIAEYFDVEPWIVSLKIGYIRRKGWENGIKYKWTDFIDRHPEG